MPYICGAYGCSVKQGQCNHAGNAIRFFRFPAVVTNKGEEAEQQSIRRRRLWYKRLRRDDLQDPDDPNPPDKRTKLTSVRVCEQHFTSG